MMVSFSQPLCTSNSLPTKNCESYKPPLGGIRVNTRAFYCSERIFIVKESYIVLQDLTSFELYHRVVISQELDLTIICNHWTSREIDSLTHSHL